MERKKDRKELSESVRKELQDSIELEMEEDPGFDGLGYWDSEGNYTDGEY